MCTGWLALLGAALSAEAAGEYRQIEVESLRITVDSEWVPVAAAGYLPVRWDITNLGDDRTIEIVGDGSRAMMRSHRFRQTRTSVRQRIRLAARDRVQFTMNVPASGEMDNIRFQIREDGRTIQTLGFISTNRMYGAGGPYSGAGGSSALLVVARNGSYAAAAPGWVRLMPGGRMAVAVSGGAAATASAGPPRDLILEPARLPDSWLGYTSVQAVVIGPREWEEATAAQRDALVTWTAAGGDLILVDAGLELIFPDAQQRPPVTGNRADHFFGRIHLWTAAEIDSIGFESTLISIASSGRDPTWTLPLNAGALPTGSGGFRLPIPGVEGVPAGAYLTLLVLFAVLIGPVNQFLLRRRGQQSLIVLTTPIIAAVFIVVLGGYVALVEGFAIRGRVISLTLLDQTAAEAVTRASVSVYASGRAPSGGLRFARDVAVFATPLETALPPREALDLTETQQFSSGFVQARTPTNFETIRARTARERLTFRRDGNELRVSNGLGGTVTRLLVRNGDRTYQLSDAIAPGASASLQVSTAAPRTLLAGGDTALARFDPMLATVPDDSYVAVLDRSPFWDGGTPDIEERSSFHVVRGRAGTLP